jgi:hypothetical protein
MMLSSLVKRGERGQLDGIAKESVDGEDPGGLLERGRIFLEFT